MKGIRKRRIFSFFIAMGCCANLMSGAVLTAHAEVIDYQAEAENNKSLPVESNEIEGWPQGPAVSAKSAILMEANTGTILYAKNIHEKLYPASTTKILTAYIARQNASLDEMVEYSPEAVNSIDWREDANIGIKAGESITMEQSLYSLMVGSANECANAIAEHISGSIENFVKLMNETAQELGCRDSHFVTTNGIHDDNHYTSSYDLALIAQKYFSDELLCRMSDTPSYVLPASPTLSRELIPNTKNKLLPGKEYAYEYLVGSKTGYTDVARQSLVSCAEKDGLKLICVVMQDESPMQFTDTIDLFNYGFSNFKAVNVAENDTSYSVNSNSLFLTENDILGNSNPILSIDSKAYVILPTDISLEDVDSELSYENLADGQAATILYTYQKQPLGTAAILYSQTVSSFDFYAEPTALPEETETEPQKNITGNEKTSSAAGQNILFLDVKRIAIAAGCILAVALIALIIYTILHNRKLSRRRRTIMNRRRARSRGKNIIDFDKYTDSY